MRDKFHRQMDHIQSRWHRLALMVVGHCRVANRSLAEPNDDEIMTLMQGDSKVVSQARAVQKGCLALIALQQPMAVDLRIITSLLRSADDVERINRSCVHIAEVAKAKLYDSSTPQFNKIKFLAAQVTRQLEDGIEAFNARDINLARAVITTDRRVDWLHREIFGSLLERIRRNDARATMLMFVSRWLERIGDRATRLACRAIYIVEGIDIESETEMRGYRVFPNRWQ